MAKKIRMERLKRPRNKQKKARPTKLTKATEELIGQIAREHSKKTFGYLDRKDLESEVWRICLEILPDYDKDTGNKLEHFLRVGVRNRMVNRFKEITKSVRSPCSRCPYYSMSKDGKTDCNRFKNSGTQKEPEVGRMECDKWKSFQMSILSRNSLLNPVESKVEQEVQDNPANKLIAKEFVDVIIQNVDDQTKKDLMNIMSGSKISKSKLEKVREIVRNILEEHGYDEYL